VFYVQDQDSLNAAYERACRELPDALRVSIVSEEGVPNLKSTVVKMLASVDLKSTRKTFAELPQARPENGENMPELQIAPN